MEACFEQLLTSKQRILTPRTSKCLEISLIFPFPNSDSSLIGSGNVDSGAIFDIKGENNWARSPNFKVHKILLGIV